MKRGGWLVLVVVVIVAVGLLNHFRPSAAALANLPAPPPSDQRVTTVTLDDLGIDGAGRDTSAVVGNGGFVVLGAGYTVDSLLDHPAISVRLERRVGTGSWTPTGRVARAISGRSLEVATPAFSTKRATEVVEYRFASETSRSPVVRVAYENPGFYTGLAATIYRDAARWCPHTAVHVTRLGGEEAGLFRTGAMLIRVGSQVGRSTVSTVVDERALAIHECSHELQWLNYGATSDGQKQAEAAAKRLFTAVDNGAAPIEHAADCGAKSVNPSGYLGYGGFCTADELAEGRRLLSGLRY